MASSRAVPKDVLRWIPAKVNVFVHHSLEELVAAMEGFVRYYNYERLLRGFGEHHAGGYVPRTARRHTGDETGGEAKESSRTEVGKSENCLSRLASKLHASKAPLLSHLF